MKTEVTHTDEIETPQVALAGNQEKRDNASGLSSLPTDLANSWLTWHCRMVAGIIRGALYLPLDSGKTGSAISMWPAEGQVEGETQLIDVASQALTENRGVVRSKERYGPENRRVCDLVASPLLVNDEPVAIAVLMISPRSELQQHAILQLLQWGGEWMGTLVKQQSASQREVVATAILGHSSSHTAAMEMVKQLAEHFECERVSMGFRQGLTIRLQAISNIASFDPRAQLVRRIEAAMEEAVDQTTSMIYPGNEDRESALNRAHAELAERHDNGAICTIPLPGQAGIIGAFTLERKARHPFEKDTVLWCEALARLIGPAMESKQREDRSFWSRGSETVLEFASNIFGASRLRLKLFILAVMLSVITLSFIDGNYRVTAPATIEGEVRQILAAPQDGYIKQADVRAGDLVKKDQLMAMLDDRNLRLEAKKWQSEYNKIEKEYQDALAKRDRTTLSVLRAQLDQVDAELWLMEEKIRRAQLRAPFDGVVVSGDLSQSLGAPVETGQVLYEVAPLEHYRVVLEVDEHDAAGLDAGKSGQLIITALPQTSFAISLDNVVPVAISRETSNFFRVEASLKEPSSLLRPGMRGIAKVDMGERSMLWILTHAAVDRIRLWLWSAGL